MILVAWARNNKTSTKLETRPVSIVYLASGDVDGPKLLNRDGGAKTMNRPVNRDIFDI